MLGTGMVGFRMVYGSLAKEAILSPLVAALITDTL
jgi:hypothetical protein